MFVTVLLGLINQAPTQGGQPEPSGSAFRLATDVLEFEQCLLQGDRIKLRSLHEERDAISNVAVDILEGSGSVATEHLDAAVQYICRYFLMSFRYSSAGVDSDKPNSNALSFHTASRLCKQTAISDVVRSWAGGHPLNMSALHRALNALPENLALHSFTAAIGGFLAQRSLSTDTDKPPLAMFLLGPAASGKSQMHYLMSEKSSLYFQVDGDVARDADEFKQWLMNVAWPRRDVGACEFDGLKLPGGTKTQRVKAAMLKLFITSRLDLYCPDTGGWWGSAILRKGLAEAGKGQTNIQIDTLRSNGYQVRLHGLFAPEPSNQCLGWKRAWQDWRQYHAIDRAGFLMGLEEMLFSHKDQPTGEDAQLFLQSVNRFKKTGDGWVTLTSSNWAQCAMADSFDFVGPRPMVWKNLSRSDFHRLIFGMDMEIARALPKAATAANFLIA